MKDIKNLKHGEMFFVDNKKYKVVAGGTCSECDLLIYCENCINFKEDKPNCFHKTRKDKTNVVFKRVD